MRSSIVFAVLLSETLLTAAPRAISSQRVDVPLRITAFAVNMSNVGTGLTNTVQIEVDRWSTEAERNQLYAAFAESGPEGLLKALQKTDRIGFIRLPTTLGYDLHFARRRQLEDGRDQITILTDRPIGGWEVQNRPRTLDYPFTLIEFRVTAKGDGEGKLSVATKIAVSKGKETLELENYATEPVRLQSVRVEPKK